MKKLLKALGITITLTAIGVGVRAIVRSEIAEEKMKFNRKLDMISKVSINHLNG